MAAQLLTILLVAPEEEVLLRQLILTRATPAMAVRQTRVLLTQHEAAPWKGVPPKRYPSEIREPMCALVRQATAQADLPATRWSLHWVRIALRQVGSSPVPNSETLCRRL